MEYNDEFPKAPAEYSSDNEEKPYYFAYENRYRKAYAAGVVCWGHTPGDKALVDTLTNWVTDNGLQGKSIIEYACGEGSCGIILSKSGCIYHGVDISPTAVEKARSALLGYNEAKVSLLDMVNDRVCGVYDAALDVMGYHMLVIDYDRKKYLRNAFDSLKPGAHMLFYREVYRRDAYDGEVNSFAEWKYITGSDYKTPERRTVINDGKEIEVYIPLVPARARTKDGYCREMTEAGFIVDDFVELDVNMQCPYSAAIYVHKPQ